MTMQKMSCPDCTSQSPAIHNSLHTEVILPEYGSALLSTAVLDATASGNTEGYGNNLNYELQSVATDVAGKTATSAPVRVAVVYPP